MMLTAETARGHGLHGPHESAPEHLAGARYFAEVLEKIPERIPEPDRTWLAVASYNVGFGHLEDARVLAQIHGKNPDSWRDVREHLPLLAQEAGTRVRNAAMRAAGSRCSSWIVCSGISRCSSGAPTEAIAKETRVEIQPGA